MKPIDVYVGDCPNVLYFRRNEKFCAESFLYEDKINWGCHKDFGGGRSVMLISLRLLFFLGVRNIFLLGCDFNMEMGNKNYCFEQDRKKSSVKSNTKTYNRNIERFEQLLSVFEKEGFQVFNCNPKSNLKVFPFVDYKDAINVARSFIPVDLENEKTEGLYEFKYDTPKMSNGTTVKDYEKKEKRKRRKEEKERKKKEREKRNANRRTKSRTNMDNPKL
jgi:hypothetical protein